MNITHPHAQRPALTCRIRPNTGGYTPCRTVRGSQANTQITPCLAINFWAVGQGNRPISTPAAPLAGTARSLRLTATRGLVAVAV